MDVLCGGFPCQDVSIANLSRAGIKHGTRSGLWYEYARVIKEMRPKYAIIENVLGLFSGGFEIVLKELAEIGYDAEWEVLPATALGAPHQRERVFFVAYPYRGRLDAERRLLSPLKTILGEKYQSWHDSDWMGIRIDRARKEAALEAYGRAVLCRVDDGATSGLDGNIRPVPSREHKLGSIDRATARQWKPRLKALGNGITPQQSYAIAACILEAEGFSPLPMPFTHESIEGLKPRYRAARRPLRIVYAKNFPY